MTPGTAAAPPETGARNVANMDLVGGRPVVDFVNTLSDRALAAPLDRLARYDDLVLWCLREELKKDGIRVTAVMPGATKTRSWEGADIPDERFMKVEDIAEAIFSAYSLSSNSVVEEIIIRPQLGDI